MTGLSDTWHDRYWQHDTHVEVDRVLAIPLRSAIDPKAAILELWSIYTGGCIVTGHKGMIDEETYVVL